MAKLRGPLASGFSGRVGEVVGAPMKGGETAIRTYRHTIKNPNTERQRVSRLRMATAAQLAAGLANAIKAGYGKAAGNTRMYPRNMFVAGLVKYDANTPLHIDGGIAEIEYDSLKISQRYGISTMPQVDTVSYEVPNQIGLTLTAQPVVDVLPAGKMGVVFVVFDPEKGTSVVEMVDAPTTGTQNVTINLPGSFSGMSVYVYAFNKWIPESGNDITTSTEPWKFPSETGSTVYCGSGTVS